LTFASEKQARIADLTAAREEAHRDGDHEAYVAHAIALKSVSQAPEFYECLACANDRIEPGSGEFLLVVHGVKTSGVWYACLSCEAAVAEPLADHCEVCARSEAGCAQRQNGRAHEKHEFVKCESVALESKQRNVWHYECECQAKPSEVNSRTIVICAKCAAKLGLLEYINKR